MKTALVLVFITSCCFLSALSLAEDAVKPPGTMIPPGNFTNQPGPDPNSTTTKPTPKPTTHTPNTTTTKVPPKPTTHTPNTTTTKVPPKPTTHTPNTTTTKVPPKPTTHTPNTTTTKVPPKPTTHTPTTTTTKAPPKPTTHKPTTTATTTAAPVTTAPSPTTDVPVGTYNLTKGKQVCVRAQIGLKIQLESGKDKGTFIVKPNMTKAVGECKDTTANLTLSFPQGFITFMFNKNVTANNVVISQLSFELNYPLVKAAASMPYKGSNNSGLFVARIGHSYSCRDESILMGNGLHLDITKNRIQAFNFSKSNDFGSPDLCPADRPNYNVAIAVGVTLLVLIIIVVVAYLIGRRRRSDGYQSL